MVKYFEFIAIQCDTEGGVARDPERLLHFIAARLSQPAAACSAALRGHSFSSVPWTALNVPVSIL